MSVAGLCGICEAARAVGSCDRCGTVVCRDHYVEEHGICTVCASAQGHGGRVP